MGAQFSQAFPPKPTFTESSPPDLAGKVYIVTGSSSGVGKELARLLYSRNATVYIGARTAERSTAAMEWIKTSHPSSTGTLHFLKLDLNDLESIKPSAEEFLSKEKRLDVLFNNAGVMEPPKGSVTKQGLDQQLGTNCLAPFLFTKLLTPLLIETAKESAPGSVRVVWVSSSAAEFFAPKGGVDIQNLDYKVDKSVGQRYAVSKAGNILYALEYQHRYKGSGLISVSLNPGNLRTELQKHWSRMQALMFGWMLHPPVNGAYTELFAGLAPEAASLKEGEWVVPWGRVLPLRKDFVGGPAGEFWDWSEGQVKDFA